MERERLTDADRGLLREELLIPGKYHSLPSAWLRDKTIHPEDKLMLMALINELRANREAWPSYAKIAEDMGLSRRCVIAGMHRLVKAKFVTVHHRKHRMTKHETNVYRIVRPVDQCTSCTSAPLAPVQEVHRDSAPDAPGVVHVVHAPGAPPAPDLLNGSTAPTERAGGCEGGFGTFWEAWPPGVNKRGKAQCQEFWLVNRLEAMAPKIVAAVGVAKRSAAWSREGGRYVPNPRKWLEERGWEGLVVKATTSQTDDSASARLLDQEREAERKIREQLAVDRRLAVRIWAGMSIDDRRKLIMESMPGEKMEFSRETQLRKIKDEDPGVLMYPHLLKVGSMQPVGVGDCGGLAFA